MCGIVGYVGPRPALDVVVEGLRRLEYRGYDSAGVAIVDADGALQVAKKAGRIENPGQGARRPGHRRARPAWATRAGPPTARPTTATRTRTPTPPAASPSCTTGSSRTSRELRAELEAAGRRVHRATPTPRRSRTSWPRSCADGATLADAVRAVCRRLHGAFTLVLVDAEHPDVVVAARRNSPLVLGVGDGEMFLGSDVAAFIEFTRDAVEMGQDQVVEITPRRLLDHRLRRQRRRRPALPHRLGPRRRREGRLRLLHAQGDRTSSRAPCADTLRGHLVDGQSCSTSSASTCRSCATSRRCSSSPAARPTTPG